MKIDRKIISNSIWFLDYDGSLCPHQEIWEERSYDPQSVLKTLNYLMALGARVLWNTGRRVESIGAIDPNFLDFSGFFIQGTVFWSAARREALVLSEPLPTSYARWIEGEIKKQSTFRLEFKPTSLRISPAQNTPMIDLASYIKTLMDPKPTSWNWVIGQRGAELLPENFHKGTAIIREMSMPISKHLIPIVVGDDLLDRPAFEEAFKRGGYGIFVGPHKDLLKNLKYRPEQFLHFSEPSELEAWIKEL